MSNYIIDNTKLTYGDVTYDRGVVWTDEEAVHFLQDIGLLETFEDNKSQKLKDLIVHVNKLHNDYLAKYPEVEIDTFKDKAREAALVMADDTIALTETPYLSKLTNNVMEARNALATVVDNKVLENAQLEVFGVTTRDAIKACATQEELDAIVW